MNTKGMSLLCRKLFIVCGTELLVRESDLHLTDFLSSIDKMNVWNVESITKEMIQFLIHINYFTFCKVFNKDLFNALGSSNDSIHTICNKTQLQRSLHLNYEYITLEKACCFRLFIFSYMISFALYKRFCSRWNEYAKLIIYTRSP